MWREGFLSHTHLHYPVTEAEEEKEKERMDRWRGGESADCLVPSLSTLLPLSAPVPLSALHPLSAGSALILTEYSLLL